MRNIFKFNDGKTDRAVDPIVVEMDYRAACEGVDIDSVMVNFSGPEWLGPESDDDPTPKHVAMVAAGKLSADAVRVAVRLQDQATRDLIPVICKTFGLKTVAQDQEYGLTYGDIITIFATWLQFINVVKKNTEPSAASPPPTVRAPRRRNRTTNGSSGTTTTPPAPPASTPLP
jgi:hypothetical protein